MLLCIRAIKKPRCTCWMNILLLIPYIISVFFFLGKPEDFFPSQHEIGGGGANLVTCWWISTQKCRALFSYSTTIRVPEEKKKSHFLHLSVSRCFFEGFYIYASLQQNRLYFFTPIRYLFDHRLLHSICFFLFWILFLFSFRILNFHPQVWSTKPEMKYGKLLKPCYDSVKKRAPIFIGLFCSK